MDVTHWFTAETWETIAFRAQVFGWSLTVLGVVTSMGGYWAKTNASHLRDAPRHLSDSESAKLVSFLAGKPAGRLVIKANIAATDARPYADEVAAVLRDRAEWTVQVDNAIMPGNSTAGFWVTIRSAAAAPMRAVSIHDGIGAAGLPMDPVYRTDNSLQPDEVWLSVGLKK